jgi:hypothetical protein
VFIKSKRDSEDENVILPTIDNPFNTPDEHLPQVTPTSLDLKLGSREQDYDTDVTDRKPGRRMGDRLCQSHVRHPDERPDLVWKLSTKMKMTIVGRKV